MVTKYPQQVLDSLQEYSERYKFNTKEYKDFIDNLGKIPNQLIEQAEIYNKGKTNLEKGSIAVIRVPTQKGIVTRAYVVLSGVPVTIDRETKVPMLDLHSYLVQEESPIESIKTISTSDDAKRNKINTEGMFFVTEDFLRRRKEALEKVEEIEEPRKLPRKKRESKKVEKKKKETKDEDIIEIPEGEESKKRKKILDTAKKIKEDKIKEKEEESIRKLEDAYTKIKFACLNAVHNMGYTKSEAEDRCSELEELIQEHAHSAVEKGTVTAVEEYVKLFIQKIVPSRIPKPRGEPRKEFIKKMGETGIRTQSNLEALLMSACFWLSSHYTETTEESYLLCEERREIIANIASEMINEKIDLIKAMRQLEMTFVKGISEPIVQKRRLSQRDMLKVQIDSVLTEMIDKRIGKKRATPLIKGEVVSHNIENGLCIFCKDEVDDKVHEIIANVLGTTKFKLYNAHKPSRNPDYDYERCFDLIFDYKASAYSASGGRITPSSLIKELEDKIDKNKIKIFISDVPIL